jgi:hypothetical protein
MARQQVAELLAQGGVALSLWNYAHGSTTNDLVVSTKLLDYCAAGLPVVLNRTAAQETLLGRDYPLFVEELDDALPRLRAVLGDASLYRAAAERCLAAAERFTYPRVYAGLAPYLETRAERSLHLFRRAKLGGAEYNLGLLAAGPGIAPAAVELLRRLLAGGGRWRLVAGRPGAVPSFGGDPAVQDLGGVPADVRARITTRTVDDPWNWWRTLGFVVLPEGRLDAEAREALASGAVPIVIGATPGDSGLAEFAYPDAAAAAQGVADLVARGAWAAAGQRAAALADAAASG